jgi:OTU domain-containing protein 3
MSPDGDAKNKEAAEKVSLVLPWMVNVVVSSLPYLADRGKIRKTLEECKGNIVKAVSILLDAEEQASVSSQPGSSCTERDPDSDDELVGPKKKQDRRMSQATKALKDKAEQQGRNKAVHTAAVTELEPVPVIKLTPAATELPVRPHKQEYPIAASAESKGDNDDGWVRRSDGEADDYQPNKDDVDDATSDYSGTEKSEVKIPPTSRPLQTALPSPKSFQQQPGPQKKRETARERIERRKLAQKAAGKESKRKGSQAALDLGMGIKTLYI